VNSRLRILLAACLTVLVIFVGRLMYLQFAMADEFKLLSENNSLAQERIIPLRGKILARDGTALATDRLATDLLYRGGPVRNWSRIQYLLKLPGPPTPPNPADLEQGGEVLAWNVPDAVAPALQELIAGQPSLSLRQRVERTYPTGLAASVLGHTTEADPQRFPGYQLGDLVGVTGLEQSYQDVLFGTPGIRLEEVNSARAVLSSRVLAPAEPGENITLSIDPRTQRLAQNTLKNGLKYLNAQRRTIGLPPESVLKGALIAMNPRTGEILALASSPTFDENAFARHPSSPVEISAILKAPGKPLFDRAVSAYPPASTFKLVTTLALLGGGYITPQTRYPCIPIFYYGGIAWHNWASTFRGNYNVSEAIADSCNTFFFQAAASTPGFNTGWNGFAKRLMSTAKALGYGQRIGLGLSDESAGLVPTDSYSREVKGYPWRPGDTLNVSIGQGNLLVTPVQMAQLVATVALGGKQVKPHLVTAVGGKPVKVPVKEIPSPYYGVLQEAMKLMVNEHSVGAFRDFPMQIAGKTGTAQNPQGPGYEHVWFAGYGPANDPRLVVVVFVQNGYDSVYVAEPIARDFMAAYWGVKLP
jgi:penicillin-binding protein 2